ncbi:MAG: 2-oxoacid:acceptor oxidoreductase subunit alpha, partial [Dehalococcoidales bacterium]|nr:2-oxoacid:acceptor oxidoreductase subunit alpha [Dehalococcoidales bacterium]
MATDFNFLAGGEAGQGIQSVGMIIAKTLSRGGYHIFADQDYESRVRGGHNFFRVRVSEQPVLTLSEKLDALIALNRETIDLHRGELKANGVIIHDREQTKFTEESAGCLDVPLNRLAMETAQNKLMVNTVAVGAALGLTACDFAQLEEVLKKEFAKAGDKLIADNIKAARAGYDFTLKRGNGQKLKPVKNAPSRMLLNGNEALSVGALAGGCKFVAGYPMTPTTSILEYLAAQSLTRDIVMIHVEDEIAAINMAVGAGYAGTRAMVATSGGGFALMVEGLALAGMTESPLVIMLGQRPGPATGLPTRTEQGELWFALHAGHGEFPRALFAPATVAEAFSITVKAFNLAEKYQVPALILTDHHLASSYSTAERFDLKQVKIERGDLLSAAAANKLMDYKRHRINKSGISPRALPGLGKALVVTDSDEHDEAGHIIEDAAMRIMMDEKRLRKANGLKAEISPPQIKKSPKAELNLVGWGSTYGAIAEAVTLLRKEGVVANHIHFSEIWPFPAEATVKALGRRKNIVIESNATGQMAQLIRRETGIKADNSILRYDGRPITPQYILDHLKKEVA